MDTGPRRTAAMPTPRARREAPLRRDLMMIDPLEYEGVFERPRGRFVENLEPSVHLDASVPLLVHAATVLGREPGRKRNWRAVTLKGDLHLPELRAEIVFDDRGEDESGNGNGRANGRGEAPWAVATVIPHLSTVAIPLQYFAPPGREESDVWALTREPNQDPAWAEHYAGQLQEAPFTFHQHVMVDAIFDLTFTHQNCLNGRGAQVEVAGEVRFERSMRMRLLFRDPEQRMAIASELDGDQAEMVVAGTRVPLPHQTVSGLAGPRSRMTVRVIDDQHHLLCAARSFAEPERWAS